MAKIVLCSKEKGNTRKICNSIAATDGWELKQITGKESLDLSGYDSVILGTGVYGGCPHKNVSLFIRGLKKEHSPKKVNILITWLGRGKSDRTTFNNIQKECSLKKISVAPEYKKYLGHSFGILHIGRPSAADISSCVEWAKGI